MHKLIEGITLDILKQIEEEYYLDEGDEIDDYDYLRYMIECCKEVESHCFSVDC